MRYPPYDSSLFIGNRARLAAQLMPDSLAILLSPDIPALSGDGTLEFSQSSDLFYLTGIPQEDTALILFPGHPDPAMREILFVRETSEMIAIWEGHKLTREQAAGVSGIGRVEWASSFDSILRRLMRQARHVYLDYNEHPRSVAVACAREDRFRERCQALYPDHHYERLAPLLFQQRSVKTAPEIERIRQACAITEDGFRRVLKFIRPGIMEYEVEAEYAHEFLRQGSNGFAYQPIIAGGANNCVLHYISNDQRLEDGDLVLMDVAAEYANYNADMTRTVPVNGRFTPRQRAVYDAVLRILRACVSDFIRPGVSFTSYRKNVARMVEKELAGLGLVDGEILAHELSLDGTPDELPEELRSYRRYFMHGVSHSLGLDVHDVTATDPKFEEGMVVTVEPGIYILGEGLGIRLENCVVVREGGNVDLMASIPLEAEEIEALMSAG